MNARNSLPRYAPIPEWCAISGIGRSVTYQWIGAGRLKAIKVGNRTLIDVWHGVEMMEGLPRANINVVSKHRTPSQQSAA